MTEHSTLERLQLVKDRLELVSIISSLNPQFLNVKMIRETSNGGWTHPWKYFDSLRTYLLLTCFDLLGQPDSFKDFKSWLSSSSTAVERTAALQKSGGESNIVEIIKTVHHEYLATYGTKNSFYWENALAYVIRDGFPVTQYHSLFIPKRHVADYFGLTQAEINAINQLIKTQKQLLDEVDETIDGYNVGMNCGESAGQTIFHCHVHLMPRRKGDVDSPRGGVRHIIAGKGTY